MQNTPDRNNTFQVIFVVSEKQQIWGKRSSSPSFGYTLGEDISNMVFTLQGIKKALKYNLELREGGILAAGPEWSWKKGAEMKTCSKRLY